MDILIIVLQAAFLVLMDRKLRLASLSIRPTNTLFVINNVLNKNDQFTEHITIYKHQERESAR